MDAQLNQYLLSLLGAGITLLLGVLAYFLKNLIEAAIKNTMELAILNTKIEPLIKRTELIPEIEKDIKALGEKTRNIVSAAGLQEKRIKRLEKGKTGK